MTSTNLHNTDQLMELAGLDALALLDEQDAAFFERAFFAAPSSVQHRILELQAAVTADPLFHAPVDPPTDLAERVLARIRAEIDRNEFELSPLAVIGRSVGQRDRERRAFFAGFGSAALWRAASLVLAAGLVTTFVFLNKAVDTNREILGAVVVDGISRSNREVLTAKGWAAMVKANRYVTLTPGEGPSREAAVATVAVYDMNGVVAVMAYGLSSTSEPYTVRAVNPASGSVLFEQMLAYDGGAFGAIVELSARVMPQLATVQFEILDKTGAVVLS